MIKEISLKKPTEIYIQEKQVIDLVSLAKSLKAYFEPKYMGISLHFRNSTKKLNITCAHEIFYQIIFSLVFNIMEIMNGQSADIKLINIDFSSNETVITYESFPIKNKEQLLVVSNIIEGRMSNKLTLNHFEILELLTRYNWDYKVSAVRRKNMIKILYNTI